MCRTRNVVDNGDEEKTRTARRAALSARRERARATLKAIARLEEEVANWFGILMSSDRVERVERGDREQLVT